MLKVVDISKVNVCSSVLQGSILLAFIMKNSKAIFCIIFVHKYDDVGLASLNLCTCHTNVNPTQQSL